MAQAIDALDALPPWDAAAYFQTPTETDVTLPGGVATQLCAADPNRVVLMFSTTGFGGIPVSTKRHTDANGGIQVGANFLPLVLRFEEVGPLCQQAWYAWSPGAGLITVFEVKLYQWPEPKPVRKGRGNANPAKPN